MSHLRSCYEVLGVNPNASAQEVRQAYLDLVKHWHPDLYVGPQDSKAAAHQHFLRIQSAYDYVKQYQAKLEDFPAQSFTPKPRRSSGSEAERLYDRAIQLARQGLYHKAIAELSAAIRTDPKYSLAYKYRGHLKAYLGLEQESKSDFVKAHMVSLSNAAAESRLHSNSDDTNFVAERSFSSDQPNRSYDFTKQIKRVGASFSLLFVSFLIALLTSFELPNLKLNEGVSPKLAPVNFELTVNED